MLLSACGEASVDQEPETGSGSAAIDVSRIIRGFVDAGSIVRASVQTLWSDVQKRADDIAQGAEKMQEGRNKWRGGFELRIENGGIENALV